MLARAPMHQHCQHQRHRQQVPSHLGPTFPPAGQQPVDEGQPQEEQGAIHRERQQEDPRIGMPAPPAIGHGDRPDHPPQKDQSDHGLRAGAILAQRRPDRARQAQGDQHAIHPAPQPHPMQVREPHHGIAEHRGRQRPQHTGRAQHRFSAARQYVAVQQTLKRQAVENFNDDGGGQKQEHLIALGHAQHAGVDRHHQQRADQQRQDHRAALRRVHECRRRPQGGFHADGRAALHPHQHRQALTRSQQQRGHRHGRRHFARGERLAVARQHHFEGLSFTVLIQVEAHVFQPGHAKGQPAFQEAISRVVHVQLQPVHGWRKAPVQPGGGDGLPGAAQDLADVLGSARIFHAEQFVVQRQFAGDGAQVHGRRRGLGLHGLRLRGQQQARQRH
ncbi:hypothetical protein D3C71_1174560 [compost metagenome]